MGAFLDDWLLAYSCPRKQATPSVGSIAVTGTAGTVIAVGTQWQDANHTYASTAVVTINALGTATVPVVCLATGAATNRAVGSPLALVASLLGVDPSAFTSAGGLQRGTDTETDAQAVYRLQKVLANPPLGGAPNDYANWAMTVPNITRAWGIRNFAGPTSVGVVVVCDNNPGGVPTAADLAAVEAYILDYNRGPMDELFVVAASFATTNYVIHLSPDSPAIRLAVEAELRDLYLRLSDVGVGILHNDLIAAANTAAGEYNHTFVAPALISGGVIAVPTGVLPAAGTITFI